MRAFFLSSLRTRLIILVLIAVMPLALVSVFRDYYEEQLIRQGLLDNARVFAGQFLKEEDRQIDGVKAIMVAVSHSPLVETDDARCGEYLRDLIEHYGELANIGVIGTDGMLRCSALPFEAPVDLSDRSYFRRAIEKKDFTIGDYQVGRVTKKATINFGYPILDRAGNVRSVLFAALDLSALGTRIEGAVGGMLPEGTNVTKVDASGTVISRYPDGDTAVGRPVSELPVLQQVLDEHKDIVTRDGPNGIRRLYMSFPLYSNLEGANITVVLGVPEAAVLANADQIFAANLTTILIVLAVCLVLAYKGSERYILRNIDKLVDATRKISGGELFTRTGIPYEEGEMGELSRAVDDMASSLRKRRQEADAAMEAASHAEAKYRSLVERVPSITYTAAVGSFYEFTYVSPQVERVLGYRPEELTSDPADWFKLVHPADVKRVSEEVGRLYEKGESFASEYRVRTKVGRLVWLHDEAVLVRGKSGGPLTYQGVLLDVTDRKRRELELEAIAALSLELRKAQSYEEMPPLILSKVDDLLDAECSALALDGAGDMVVRYGFGRCEEWVGRTLPGSYDAGFTGLGRGGPYIFPDASEDPLIIDTGTRGHVVSSLCSPIVFHGQPTGWLWVGLRSEVAEEDIRVISAVCDIAANALHREKLFDLTEKGLEKLTALRTIDMAITGSLDLHVVLDVALDQMISRLGVDAAGVLLLNPHDNTLRFMAGKGFVSRDMRTAEVRLGEGLAGGAAYRRQVVVAGDLEKHKDSTRAAIFRNEGFVSACFAPLIAKGTVKGVIEVFNRTPAEHGADWVEFLESLGMQMAIAVDNAGLFDEIQRSHTELQMAYETTIEGWARALDYRDRETEGHSRRVTEITVEIARAMGMPDEELVHVRRGALLHDIGKLAVPDSILLKPGPLTEEEWAVMKRHPEFAYELLAPIHYLLPAVDIPYCHHEKWAGNGYPQGLKGEHIPLPARIFAVVDVWDALLSDRPYRKAWPEGKVREHIFSEMGNHFDPKVVDVFLRMDWDKLKKM